MQPLSDFVKVLAGRGIRIFLIAVSLCAPVHGASSPSDRIRVGMTAAFSGPSRQLGENMKAGMDACFAAVNRHGGIVGRQIRLITRDDGYEPARAAPNMRALIDQDHVLAVLGNVGTPTAIVTVPIADVKRTLLFGALSGADVLRRTPPDRYVINYRASYAEETASMVDLLLGMGIDPRQIAFFTQRDSFGDAGYRGAIAALKARGFSKGRQLVHARYTRNTLNVEDAVAALLDAPIEPQAVIMVSSYAASAKFIRLAKRDMPNLLFLIVSFGGGGALIRELGNDSDGVIVTQVVPSPDSDLPLIRQYRKDLQRHQPGAAPDYVSLEGYIVARIFVEALRGDGPAPDRQSIIDSLEKLHNLDIGLGIPISFGPDKHQAVHRVWPTVISNGRFVNFDPASLRLDAPARTGTR
jgi:ABC-type branched-subunit amino acid transport system substrate-binding protein